MFDVSYICWYDSSTNVKLCCGVVWCAVLCCTLCLILQGCCGMKSSQLITWHSSPSVLCSALFFPRPIPCHPVITLMINLKLTAAQSPLLAFIAFSLPRHLHSYSHCIPTLKVGLWAGKWISKEAKQAEESPAVLRDSICSSSLKHTIHSQIAVCHF